MSKTGSACLIEERIEPYKQLAAFAKHHRVPTTCSDSDHRYLADLAESDIDADLQEVFSALRKSFGLKRKEISVDGPSDGGGVITTPFFNYEIQVILNPEDPSKVIWRRMITGISEPARVFAGPFEDVFGNRFTILEVNLADPLDLEAIVDHIEDIDIETVKIDYDKDLTWCEIKFTDSTSVVMINAESIRVISRREIAPIQLLESFSRIQSDLLSMLNLNGIPFLAGSD
ncbi:MAG: hypothetical protein ACI814_001956 [Mariniblastus sp.]|jgi:hypothetical protein